MPRLTLHQFAAFLLWFTVCRADEVELPRRVVSSCTGLLSALEAPETVSIDIVRSFSCDTSTWNRTVFINRDLSIRGRKRRGVLPQIDWGTSSKRVIATGDSTVYFTDLIFLQHDMGIGSIDILFFQTVEQASAVFTFVVVGVRSCPFMLNVTHFEALRRPRDYSGPQDSLQIDDVTVEAQDVWLEWTRSQGAVWHLHHTVFTCNVLRNDPALMQYYNVAVQSSGHHDDPYMHPQEPEDDSQDTGKLVIYILVSVAAAVLFVGVIWFLIAWSRSGEDPWVIEVGDEEKGSYFAESYPEDPHGRHKASPTPENWGNLDSEVALEAPLGHGEFGKVYKGGWQGTTVAVKVIKHNDRCLRTNVGGPLEAFFARHISHPNVVQTYQIMKKMAASVESPSKFFGSSSEKKRRKNPESESTGSCSTEDMFGSFDDESGNPYHDGAFETWLILEYCDKGSLSDAVSSGIFRQPQRESHFRMSFVAKTALEIASAMNYLHSVRIIHGDLKTGNVLLKGDGSDPRGFICKVGDFGLSRFLAEDSHIETFTCGTVTHMPPELLKGGRLTSAADVYSFGILLWELFSGKKPHQGKNQGEIVLAVVNNGARPAFPPNVPRDFTELIQSCWQQDYMNRPIFPEIIDQLSKLLAQYEKEEGLSGTSRPSRLSESHTTRSSFFSPHETDRPTEKKKSLRLVPKKFSSLRVNPAVATAQASVFLDSNRSLHLSLDGNDRPEADNAINSLHTTRSVD